MAKIKSYPLSNLGFVQMNFDAKQAKSKRRSEIMNIGVTAVMAYMGVISLPLLTGIIATQVLCKVVTMI